MLGLGLGLKSLESQILIIQSVANKGRILAVRFLNTTTLRRLHEA